jgi:hypothetical protein
MTHNNLLNIGGIAMARLPLTDFVYYGLLLTTLVLYLTLYVKLRKNIVTHRRKITQYWIVLSFLIIGIMAAATNLVKPVSALAPAGLACAIAYYVVFIKYND